ncbi:alkaline ceramidase 3-like [Actinia tenebrosa]|uniref:Alkaline ceramidase n=1 Tax=Actinia tenebrosa TaxID=6105 RepID=A0A6P8IIF6_ACTTE|nr:alkaline ceramidase 3-like [Actinia tenebrosa]
MAPAVQRIYGFWGEPTSTLDWCEENYVVTNFVAEFWNTISNWMMIVPPALGLLLTWQTRNELRFMIAFLSLFMVGIGSLCFHATLLFEMQLLDELPMIYCSCVFLFCIIECASTSGKNHKALVVFLMFISLLISVVYMTIKNPLLFQWAYGILVACVTLQALVKCRKYHCSKKLLAISVISYGTGFILWNIENNFCPSVRYLRDKAFTPFQLFTQLHAVWHLLAGIGSYYHILFSLDLRMRCKRKSPKLMLVWGWLPYIYSSEKTVNNNSECKSVPVSLYQMVYSYSRSW